MEISLLWVIERPFETDGLPTRHSPALWSPHSKNAHCPSPCFGSLYGLSFEDAIAAGPHVTMGFLAELGRRCLEPSPPQLPPRSSLGFKLLVRSSRNANAVFPHFRNLTPIPFPGMWHLSASLSIVSQSSGFRRAKLGCPLGTHTGSSSRIPLAR